MKTDDALAETPPLAPAILSSFPMDRWARVAASIDANPGAEAAVLEANALEATTWEQLDDHWLAVQDAELSSGDTSSLEASDAAYLARLEEERGAITPDEYARLVVAAERGTLADALEAAELSEPASLVLERVWCRRCAANAELADATDKAVSRARAGVSP